MEYDDDRRSMPSFDLCHVTVPGPIVFVTFLPNGPYSFEVAFSKFHKYFILLTIMISQSIVALY